MSQSRFLSIISVAFGAAAGCSGNDCGTLGAAEFGLAVSGAQVDVAFGDLRGGANNDCPDPMAPAGVVSLTISGGEMGGGGLITFCVPRPDQLMVMALPLGSAGVKVIDLTATDPSCTYTFDAAHLPMGTVSSKGMCGNGVDPAGFGLVFDGYVGLRRTCATTIDTVDVTLKGSVAVTPM